MLHAVGHSQKSVLRRLLPTPTAKLPSALLVVASACGWLTWTCPSAAYQAEVDATLDAQFYSLQSPYGSPLVQRRRYTQTLALNLYDLQNDRRPLGPSLSFKSRVRLDSDFGQRPEERNPDSSSYIPGLYEAPMDLMYAYLDGQRYLGGLLGFRIGRQYVIDTLGFWSFDGADVVLTTPAFFAVEAYAGFEQRGGLAMLSTSRFEAGGIARGDRSGLAVGQSPTFLQESRLAPAYGVACESVGLRMVHARLSYRKVINRDAVLVSPFLDNGSGLSYVSGDRTSSERVAASLRADASDFGAALGSIVYDLYNRRVSQYALGLDWYSSDRVVFGGALDYFVPTFDGDSIFNWFAHRATTQATLRGQLSLLRTLELAASAGAKRFAATELRGSATSEPDTRATYDFLATLGGRYRFWGGSLLANAMVEAGEAGHRYGGDVTGRRSFDGGYYDAVAVLSLYDWEDALRTERSATSFSYVLGGGVSPTFLNFSRGRLGIEWEHTMNRLVGQRFRMLATLDFTVLR